MTAAGEEGGKPDFRLWAIPVSVGCALLMDLMDSAALATALPTIADDFGRSSADMRLALTAYMMTVAVLVPLSGWATARFGAKRLFLTAMVTFLAGSTCCAISSSFEQMVVARILQGCGGALMTPVGRSIIVSTAPRNRLVHAMGWFTLPVVLGPLLGPPLAGVLISEASWRWIFLINIPIGVVGLSCVALLVPHSEPVQRNFDFVGFAILVMGMLSLAALIESGGYWSLAGQAALASIAIVAGLAYTHHARKIDHPIIDLGVLRHPTVRVGLITGWLGRLAVGATPFLLAIFLQVHLGYSPLTMSVVLVMAAVGTFLSRYLVPAATKQIGFRGAMMIFAGLAAVLSALPMSFDAQTSLYLIGAVMALAGFFRGAMLLANTSLVYSDTSQNEVPHASVMLAMIQQFSFAIGVTVAALAIKFGSAGEMPDAGGFILAFGFTGIVFAACIPVLLLLSRDAAAHVSGQSGSK